MGEEIRLVAMTETKYRLIRSALDTPRRQGWVNMWNAGITEEEAHAAQVAVADAFVMQADDEPAPNAATRVWRKLRALSTCRPERNRGCDGA